jgi:hypothetical protein
MQRIRKEEAEIVRETYHFPHLALLIPSFCFPHCEMSMVTRKKNANAHPGQIVLDSQQRRRTKDQIIEDKACAQAEATARQQAIAAKHRAVIACITDLEASVEQEERMVQKYQNRPDLRHGQGITRPPHEGGSKDETGEDEPDKDEDEDNEYTYSGGPMPSDSTVANESLVRSDDDDNDLEEVPDALLSELDDGIERQRSNGRQNQSVGISLGFRFTQR